MNNLNEEPNFLLSSHDVNFDSHNFNQNFQKEFSQIQNSIPFQQQNCFQNQNNFPSPKFTDMNNIYYNNQQQIKNININLNNVNQNSLSKNTNVNQDFNQACNQNFNGNGNNRFNSNMNINKTIQMQNANNFNISNNNNFQNQIPRNFPYITKTFQMENYPNSPMPSYNASTSCNYPNDFNRNCLSNTSDSEYPYNQANQKNKEHANKTSIRTFNPYLNTNINENCNMVFNSNNYNFNHFYEKQSPYFNNNNPNNNSFIVNNQKHFNMLNQVKNPNSSMHSNNFNYYQQQQMNNSYNIELANNCNNSFNFNLIQNKNLKANSENNLINSVDNSNNNLNDNKSNSNNSIGKASKSKKIKNKNKTKSFKGFTNPETNLCRSFQSMENNNDDKTYNNSINTNKSNKFINNRNNNLNNPYINNQEKELIGWNNNNIIEIGSSHGSNLSGFSGYYNELIDSSSCNLEDSMKSLEINSQFKKGNFNGYSSDATDSNSKENSFSSEKKIESNNSSGFKKSVGKNLSGKANNKKSLFNKEKREPLKEMKEDLITFLDNINFELDEYICSQKGSRYLLLLIF